MDAVMLAEILHCIKLARVIFFELLHAGGRQKYRRIVGNQRRRRHDRMSALFKKLKKFFADLFRRLVYNARL